MLRSEKYICVLLAVSRLCRSSSRPDGLTSAHIRSGCFRPIAASKMSPGFLDRVSAASWSSSPLTQALADEFLAFLAFPVMQMARVAVA